MHSLLMSPDTVAANRLYTGDAVLSFASAVTAGEAAKSACAHAFESAGRQALVRGGPLWTMLLPYARGGEVPRTMRGWAGREQQHLLQPCGHV